MRGILPGLIAGLCVSSIVAAGPIVSLPGPVRQHPELAETRIRDLAAVRPPDAIPSLQRVVQHISWAPVIVDLDWKKPPP